jgi:hypothetical protein
VRQKFDATESPDRRRLRDTRRKSENQYWTAQEDTWDLVLTILHVKALQFYRMITIAAAITG